VVVAEDSHRRDGRFIEIVGTYDPLRKPAAIEVNAESILKWLSQGAQPTDTVRRILAKCGVWAHWRAVQKGEAKIEDMTGTVAGTMERGREARPSKKTAAKIQEEEVKTAEAPAAEAAGEEESEPPTENGGAESEPAEEPGS
jgi:small subunit ribosomal protein S16